ncbi:two component transcriptional regulator, LuxR family [Duganella sp. CF402]|uniref:response regulator transcription factor n=1 Tax=unclassified Duganella TaxID=2636909 RepID=UPI0008AFAC5A|nr:MULTISPECIES: response regulator transcription factor [unclassified Duganella]RZT11012.1 LuxR family two component transcriptional regulator [Duganella sp. BK701]SEK85666.1 two component transcriptional regulator, LuxR family [Duganella sp. CF402]
MNQIDYSDSLIYIVDDEAPLRDAISSLLRSVGMQVASFSSVAAFLAEPRKELTSCLLLDVRMPGVSGLDFQAELNRDGVALPIIFMSGHGDIPMSVRAMKAGAVDFLAKPFRDQDLLDAIHVALAADRERRQRDQARHGITARYATLTPREREIMALAARGLMNKQIAGEVGTSEITVKIHRGNAMRKMQAKTFADLVRMAEALGLA